MKHLLEIGPMSYSCLFLVYPLLSFPLRLLLRAHFAFFFFFLLIMRWFCAVFSSLFGSCPFRVGSLGLKIVVLIR